MSEEQKPIVEAATQMIEAINDAATPKQKKKSYSYKTTNKNGEEKTKTVVRVYENKKDTELTLQNKEHKAKTIENIISNYDKIMEQPPRKRISYIQSTCLPENVTSSYNTIKAIWITIMKQKTEQKQ